MPGKFDHIEAHVSDIPKYCAFLKVIFEGGAYEVISASGTSMFASPEGLRIEVKAKKTAAAPASSGFCNPCLRRPGAEEFIAKTLGLAIEEAVDSPQGRVYFFLDHEGVRWHIKDFA